MIVRSKNDALKTPVDAFLPCRRGDLIPRKFRIFQAPGFFSGINKQHLTLFRSKDGWRDREECSTRPTSLRVDPESVSRRTAINTMVDRAISGYSLAASSLSDHTGRTGADIFSHERRTLYLSLSSSPDGTSLDNYCCVYGDPVLRVRRSS